MVAEVRSLEPEDAVVRRLSRVCRTLTYAGGLDPVEGVVVDAAPRVAARELGQAARRAVRDVPDVASVVSRMLDHHLRGRRAPRDGSR